ncbi:MAG: 50S ribosomal protein L19e [Candidatus Micrarchaeia archaeon]
MKRLASRAFGCGKKRVRIVDQARAGEALTADDVRALVKDGAIEIKRTRGVGHAKATRKASRKHAGRRRGEGSKKGSQYATYDKKDRWMSKVRAQRALLQTLKPRLIDGAYAKLYRMVKGNNFKNKRLLAAYAGENKLLK